MQPVSTGSCCFSSDLLLSCLVRIMCVTTFLLYSDNVDDYLVRVTMVVTVFMTIEQQCDYYQDRLLCWLIIWSLCKEFMSYFKVNCIRIKELCKIRRPFYHWCRLYHILRLFLQHVNHFESAWILTGQPS